MFVSKVLFNIVNGMLTVAQERNTEMLRREGALRQQVADLQNENTRQRADIDWFKLRLNSIEKERAQLIAAAIGVKISIPEFQTTQKDPTADALQDFMPNLASIGGDAVEEEHQGPTMEVPVDYSMMPGYRGASR